MRDQWGYPPGTVFPGEGSGSRGQPRLPDGTVQSPGCVRLTGSDLPNKAERQPCRRGCWYWFQSSFSAGSWEQLLPALNATSVFRGSTGSLGAALRLGAWCCGHQVLGSSQRTLTFVPSSGL